MKKTLKFVFFFHPEKFEKIQLFRRTVHKEQGQDWPWGMSQTADAAAKDEKMQ